MPECNQIVTMLSEYLDRDLPPETCATVEAHLRSCPDCEHTAAGLRRTVALCRDFRTSDQPAPLNPDKHRELRLAFEKALQALRQARSGPTP